MGPSRIRPNGRKSDETVNQSIPDRPGNQARSCPAQHDASPVRPGKTPSWGTAGANVPGLERSALGICARHDPRHLHMASHVGADAQDMSWLIGFPIALQGVWIAGVTKPLGGGLKPAGTTHDEVHDWETRPQDRSGTTSVGAVPHGSHLACQMTKKRAALTSMCGGET